MIHAAQFPLARSAGLALFCVLVMLLAWAAPAIVAVTDGLWDDRQPVNEPANEPSEAPDVTDEPVALFAASRPGWPSIEFPLSNYSCAKLAWSSAPPLHPPTALH